MNLISGFKQEFNGQNEQHISESEDFQDFEYENCSPENLNFALETIKRDGGSDLISKYTPIKFFGQPKTHSINGIETSFYWLENLYLFNILRKNLNVDIISKDKFIHLSLCNNFGIFSYILHKEYKNCSQIITHHNSQLRNIKFLIEKKIPEAKICDLLELIKSPNFNSNKIHEYDFLFLSLESFEILDLIKIDLLSSFYFENLDQYIYSNIFKNTPLVYLSHLYESLPDDDYARVYISLNHLHSDYSSYYNFIARKK